MEEGQVYRAVDEGEKCNFGEVFVTDGRIKGLDLTILEDDKQVFPIYNPSLTVSEEVIDQYPELAKVFAPISEKLDNRSEEHTSELQSRQYLVCRLLLDKK